MKFLTITSFFLIFVLISASALAQVQFYDAEIDLSESGVSSVELSITFEKPESRLSFSILGRIENFSFASTADSIGCSLKSGGISFVDCSFNLTQEKRTIKLSFETVDFVKRIGNKYFFDSDLSLGQNISWAHVSVKLPKGMSLLENITASKISFPESSMIVSDGRRIIVIWQLTNITFNQVLRFQFLYEGIPTLPTIEPKYFIIVAFVAIAVFGFVYIKYLKKPEKLVLSVLDEFERKVMNMIISSGGVVNQKKVVQETNLSKAKVSRIVKSLVDRGLIKVERFGRTNKLKLVKKKLSF